MSGLAASLEAARPDAMRRAVRVCDGDVVAAEELVDEVLVRIWERGRRLDEPVSVGYVVRSVGNAAINRWRSRRRHEAKYPLVAMPTSVGAGDDRAIDRVEVTRLLAALPPQQQRFVALRYLHGLSQAEVAAVVGVPQGTVASGTARALDRMRALVDV